MVNQKGKGQRLDNTKKETTTQHRNKKNTRQTYMQRSLTKIFFKYFGDFFNVLNDFFFCIKTLSTCAITHLQWTKEVVWWYFGKNCYCDCIFSIIRYVLRRWLPFELDNHATSPIFINNGTVTKQIDNSDITCLTKINPVSSGHKV